MRVQVCFSALHRTIENTVYNYFKNENKSNKNECHKLTPDCELWKTSSFPLFHHWNYTPSFCPKSEFLLGPASLKSTRSIVYPCDKFKCFIGCPCFQCQGKLVNLLSNEEHFQDHMLYHNAIHLDCKFCMELLKNFPAFSFDKYSSNQKTIIKSYIFQHRRQYLSRPLRVNNFGKEKKTKKIHICDICNKTFKKSCNKERHYMTEHYKQRYECDDCNKVFNWSDNLKSHKKNTCNKEFVSSSDDTNSESEIDRSNFSQSDNLKSHKMKT